MNFAYTPLGDTATQPIDVSVDTLSIQSLSLFSEVSFQGRLMEVGLVSGHIQDGLCEVPDKDLSMG